MAKSLRVKLRDALQDGEALLTRVTSAVFNGRDEDLLTRVRSAVLNEQPDYALPPTWETGVRLRNIPAAPEISAPSSVNVCIARAREWLLDDQQPEGYWLAELGADTTLVSDYICLMRFFGEHDPVKERRLINRLLSQIQDDGGWNIYPGGPSEINVTLKAYFALKLAGYAADHPILARAREVILRLGGIPACNSFAKILFAIFGQWDWNRVPAVVPELILLPKWFYFNIYQISYWSRAILVPLSILYHYRPHVPVPEGMGLEEIRRLGPPDRGPRVEPWTWESFFTAVDRGLRRYAQRPIGPIRRLALHKAHAWLREHCAGEGGLGAIYPAIMNSILALKCLGDPADQPLIDIGRTAMRSFEIQEGETVRLQPCFSPVWDTAWSVQALAAAGVPLEHPRLHRSTEWLLEKEVRIRGDWGVEVPWKEPGGWFFQFENAWYPDTDDTACVGLALLANPKHDPQRRAGAIERAVKWLLSMQSRDGGWGAFDRDNSKYVFEKVPFADHNALLDPPTVDVTARILEFFATVGYDRAHPTIARGIAFLERNQESDGSWYGRWGVNYIYGTWGVLRGLTTLGLPRNRESLRRGAEWLKSVQQPDGGWGESCATYDHPSLKGGGPSCASQTAWGTMGVLSVCGPDDPAVRRGIAWLLRTQNAQGTWNETQFTGGGFPKVFYLLYSLYRHYFPLLALSEFRRSGGRVD